jgi:hypothetical protein
MKPSKRWILFAGAFCLLVLSGINGPGTQLPPAVGDTVSLPALEAVGETQFHQERYQNRNLLLFVSTKDSAEQSKQWGAAIGPNFANKIARWNDDHGQKVLVVPVLDSTVDILSYLPKWALEFLVRQLGGSDRDAVLIDSEGAIRGLFQPISSHDTLLVLLGPNFTLQTFVIGEPSQTAEARLISALNADVAVSVPTSGRQIPAALSPGSR